MFKTIRKAITMAQEQSDYWMDQAAKQEIRHYSALNSFQFAEAAKAWNNVNTTEKEARKRRSVGNILKIWFQLKVGKL